MPRDTNTQGFDSSSMNYKSCWACALLAGKISQLGVSAAQEVCPLLLQQQEPADELHLARCTRKAPGSPRQDRHRCLGTRAQHACGHGQSVTRSCALPLHQAGNPHTPGAAAGEPGHGVSLLDADQGSHKSHYPWECPLMRSCY